jgi:hypothetical protein
VSARRPKRLPSKQPVASLAVEWSPSGASARRIDMRIAKRRDRIEAMRLEAP